MAIWARRVLVVSVAVWVLFVAGRGLYLAWLSPEDHVRRRLEQMADGFNDSRLGPCLAGFDPALRIEPEGVSRETLRQGLSAFFFRGVDPESKRFAYRVELPDDELRVSVDPDGSSAQVELTARFEHLARGAWSPTWRVRVDGALEEREERGWVFVRARATTLEGHRPRY